MSPISGDTFIWIRHFPRQQSGRQLTISPVQPDRPRLPTPETINRQETKPEENSEPPEYLGTAATIPAYFSENPAVYESIEHSFLPSNAKTDLERNSYALVSSPQRPRDDLRRQSALQAYDTWRLSEAYAPLLDIRV